MCPSNCIGHFPGFQGFRKAGRIEGMGQQIDSPPPA
jgi:hypothetical protein